MPPRTGESEPPVTEGRVYVRVCGRGRRCRGWIKEARSCACGAHLGLRAAAGGHARHPAHLELARRAGGRGIRVGALTRRRIWRGIGPGRVVVVVMRRGREDDGRLEAHNVRGCAVRTRTGVGERRVHPVRAHVALRVRAHAKRARAAWVPAREGCQRRCERGRHVARGWGD